jgi:hypothetical protein
MLLLVILLCCALQSIYLLTFLSADRFRIPSGEEETDIAITTNNSPNNNNNSYINSSVLVSDDLEDVDIDNPAEEKKDMKQMLVTSIDSVKNFGKMIKKKKPTWQRVTKFVPILNWLPQYKVCFYVFSLFVCLFI